MSKIIWLSIAILSVIVSVVKNFNAKSVSGFLIGSLILAIIIFGILTLIFKTIQNIKDRNTKKAILFGVISVIAIVIFSFEYFSFSSDGLCALAIQPAHFRTNILTGQCNFGGYATCLTGDPWYYKSGCDISSEKKIKILKKTGWYDQAWYDQSIEECNMWCQRKIPVMYCSDRRSYFGSDRVSEVYCKDLISCDSIYCY